MKIVILGAGALGTALAASLTQAGETVSLIARGGRAADLTTHGARITGLMDATVPVTVVTDPRQVEEADVLIVTVKTYDMASALASVQHLRVDSVASVQNGVEKNDQLAHTFGWEKVIGAMAWLSAEVMASGIVRLTANNGIYLGEWPEGISDRVQTLADTLARAGVVSEVTPSIQSIDWSKYVMFTCTMAPAVLTRLETHKFLQDERTASVTASLLHELVRIATAQAITLMDLPLFATHTLSRLSFEDTVAHLRQFGDQLASQAPTHKISTLQDLEQGKKRLEVEETLGYAVRKAAELGVATPTMDTCYKLVASISQYLP